MSPKAIVGLVIVVAFSLTIGCGGSAKEPPSEPASPSRGESAAQKDSAIAEAPASKASETPSTQNTTSANQNAPSEEPKSQHGNTTDAPSAPADEPSHPMREWTATSGHRVRALLVRSDESTVWLKKEDGKVVDVPLVKLSEADRAYVGSKSGTGAAEASPTRDATGQKLHEFYSGFILTDDELAVLRPHEAAFKTWEVEVATEEGMLTLKSGWALALWCDPSPVPGGKDVVVHWMIPATSRTEFNDHFMGKQGVSFRVCTFGKNGWMIYNAVQMNKVFEKSQGSFSVSTPSKDELSGSSTIYLHLSDGTAHSNVLPIAVQYPPYGPEDVSRVVPDYLQKEAEEVFNSGKLYFIWRDTSKDTAKVGNEPAVKIRVGEKFGIPIRYAINPTKQPKPFRTVLDVDESGTGFQFARCGDVWEPIAWCDTITAGLFAKEVAAKARLFLCGDGEAIELSNSVSVSILPY